MNKKCGEMYKLLAETNLPEIALSANQNVEKIIGRLNFH